MDPNRLEKIYASVVKNSVGNDKKFSFVKKVKNVKLKVAIMMLIAMFTLSMMSGCTPDIKEVINDYGVESEEQTYNGYSIYDISNYESKRSKKLLDSYDFDYTKVGLKRAYSYNAEEYLKISELDESYLYGFYMSTTRETLNVILKALGYTDLKDYLIKNNYVDDEGTPSIFVWRDADLIQISEIMKAEDDNLELR